MTTQNWICCQLGAREHYAVPRSLHYREALGFAFTDLWVTPGNLLGLLKRSLRERYHAQLSGARVVSRNLSALRFELAVRIHQVWGWDRLIARNEWFQRQAISVLSGLGLPKRGGYTVFAYSYAAWEIFRYAKERGWGTVLGQIDPGARMGRVIRQLHEADADCEPNDPSPPEGYWRKWREECHLADVIVVNSGWSREALVEEGITAEKVRVVPLAFETPMDAMNFKRQYPDSFTECRPLRVLFVGQVSLLKGILQLLEAAVELQKEPIEFRLVGPVAMELPETLRGMKGVNWWDRVDRSRVATHYQWADVLLFPACCDGFGLAQLEAQAWKLPVVASAFCGEVVEDGVNGFRLPEVSSAAIARILRFCLHRPELLARFSANSGLGERFGLAELGPELVKLGEELQGAEFLKP